MEKEDKGSTLIRIGVSGESSFWYRPTRVVPDQRPLNGRCCVVVTSIEIILAAVSRVIDMSIAYDKILLITVKL